MLMVSEYKHVLESSLPYFIFSAFGYQTKQVINLTQILIWA